jgi:hypothetical protein
MLDNGPATFWVIGLFCAAIAIPTVGSSVNRSSLNRNGYDTSRERVDPEVQQQAEDRETECAKANAKWHLTEYLPEGCDRDGAAADDW